jgi:hypothetical protein
MFIQLPWTIIPLGLIIQGSLCVIKYSDWQMLALVGQAVGDIKSLFLSWPLSSN